MTRGFVTVATGNLSYYKVAANLVRSFRLFDKETPFAIICDGENEYTKYFTDVVILKEPHRNYLDKFHILTDSPYDETIFIESDCIIYRDLSHLWEMLSREYDFTAFGYNDSEFHWFTDKAYAAEKFFGDPEAKIPMFCPAYMFIRKGEVCNKIYDDCLRVIREIEADEKMRSDKKLYCRNAIRDDPVFFIAMALHGCRCVDDPAVGKCIFLPSQKRIDRISLSKGQLDVYWDRELKDCNLLHFSSRRTREEGLYPQQVLALGLIEKGNTGLLLKIVESKPFFFVLDVYKKVTTKIRYKTKALSNK